MIPFALAASLIVATTWQHPMGLVTEETIHEVRGKITQEEWARKVYEQKSRELSRWREVSIQDLRAVFPKTRSNVYHNFSCPEDRTRLTFDPFNDKDFTCPSCGKVYAGDVDAGVYPKGDRYHGTIYDGWASMFYLQAPEAALDLAVQGWVDGDNLAIDRAIEILMMFAETIRGLPTDLPGQPMASRILTYQREGESTVVADLAQAYELVRHRMTGDQRDRFEKDALQRMLDDTILDPVYPYDHNNISRYTLAVILSAIALEDEDRIDWCLGFGDFDPDKNKEHRSIRRVLASHFKPDGAFWEMCSGYHLYPLHSLCEFSVLTHNLSGMDPARFPPEKYDLTDRANPSGESIRAGLEWFLSMAMPDRTMPTIGDSMAARAGMEEYYLTAEVGYRYYDVQEIGDYPSLRKGQRTWAGLLYGAPLIEQATLPFETAYLSSGWVSLRNEWEGNRVWAGLNALIPGGGHQHADRLNLLIYSHGELLTVEKATPYNELITRDLGTFSQMHNTVTVDQQSQTQGEALKPEQVPTVYCVASTPLVQFSELRGDQIYPQASVYRRSVAVIEDIVVDLFRVEGGETHDWTCHHIGGPTKFSFPLEPGTFDPVDWIANGTDKVLVGMTDESWSASWRVGDVTSRLTLAGSPGTTVYALETYPLEHGKVTAEHPPCRSLCVRRTNDEPYLAVWDSWKSSPNLRDVIHGDGSAPGVVIRTSTGEYACVFGPGECAFPDGRTIRTDAACCVWKADEAVAILGGTEASFNGSSQPRSVQLNLPGSVWVEWRSGAPTVTTLPGLIAFDTVGGENRPRPAAPIQVTLGN